MTIVIDGTNGITTPLIITNTTAENSFVVNDANPDSTPYVIDAVGNIGHGLAIPAFKYDLELANPTLGIDGIRITNIVNDTISAATRLRKARGDVGAPLIVSNGDYVGTYHYDAYDGASYIETSRINFRVDAAASVGIVPGRIEFLTANSTGVITEALRIDSNQRTILSGVFRRKVYTVATLPAGAAGDSAFVSDATATTFASIVAGGGANGVPVYSDGTNWRIG